MVVKQAASASMAEEKKLCFGIKKKPKEREERSLSLINIGWWMGEIWIWAPRENAKLELWGEDVVLSLIYL